MADGLVEQALELTLGQERRLSASFEADAGQDLDVADYAASLLLAILTQATPEPTTIAININAEDDTISGNVEQLHLHAQVYIGVRAWRAMRASRAVLSVGYGSESRALDRIIIELQAHRRSILDDPSGKEARAWLQGERGRGISARVKKITPTDLYKNLSHDSHGDPVPVQRLYDEASGSLLLSPRRERTARASLLMHAGFARDQAVLIAELARLEFGGVVRALDEVINSRRDVLAAEVNADHAADPEG
ncbi:MAG TPA: hypothetical protein VFY45_08310 [Baekduia sp.]|nr:hypothetical protein [Baekduia sp.]